MSKDKESWPLNTPVVGYGFGDDQDQTREFPQEIQIAAPWDTITESYGRLDLEIEYQKETARTAAQEAIDLCKAQFHAELMETLHTAEGWSELDLEVGRAYTDLIKGLAAKYAPKTKEGEARCPK